MARITNSNLESLSALVNELRTDHATFKTVVDEIKTLLNQVRLMQMYGARGNPGFAIDTNFDVKNANAITYVSSGTLKTLAANTSFDTGTAATFPAGRWGAALLSVSASATTAVTWQTSTSSGFASEAAAIAALAVAGADYTNLGYVTVKAHASNAFTAGTDALKTGTGGNVAAETNYYNEVNPNALLLTDAVSNAAPATLAAAAMPTAAVDYYK